MILLSALHKLSAIPQQSYQFPILGIIALILAILAYLLLFWLSDSDKVARLGKLDNLFIAFWFMALGLSIYGLAAGIAGTTLFITALSLVSILILGVIVYIIIMLYGLSDAWNPSGRDKRKEKRKERHNNCKK